LPEEVTEVIEVTGNQYAKRHAARATEGRDLGYFASITGTFVRVLKNSFEIAG
jgi:hypothetical protein